MATPAVTKVNKSFNVDRQSATVLSWDVKDQDGVAIDIDTGYTATMLVSPASSPNPSFAPISISAGGTLAFGSDGVLTLTCPYQLFAALPSARNTYIMKVSNDSGTTYSIVASGSLVLLD